MGIRQAHAASAYALLCLFPALARPPPRPVRRAGGLVRGRGKEEKDSDKDSEEGRGKEEKDSDQDSEEGLSAVERALVRAVGPDGPGLEDARAREALARYAVKAGV